MHTGCMGCGSCDGTGSVGDCQCGRGQGKCQTTTGVVHTGCMGYGSCDGTGSVGDWQCGRGKGMCQMGCGSCDGTCRVEEARVSFG